LEKQVLELALQALPKIVLLPKVIFRGKYRKNFRACPKTLPRKQASLGNF